MFFVVDLFAIFILLFVDLLFLLSVECAAVSGAVVVNLLGRLGLVGVGFGGLAGSHLTAMKAVRRALLLIGLAVVDGVGFDGVSVMFFVIDLTAGGVLLAVDLLFFLAGQLATVGSAIVVNLLVDLRLGSLGLGGFAGGHLTAAEPVGDALILIGFTCVRIITSASAAVGS